MCFASFIIFCDTKCIENCNEEIVNDDDRNENGSQLFGQIAKKNLGRLPVKTTSALIGYFVFKIFAKQFTYFCNRMTIQNESCRGKKHSEMDRVQPFTFNYLKIQ